MVEGGGMTHSVYPNIIAVLCLLFAAYFLLRAVIPYTVNGVHCAHRGRRHGCRPLVLESDSLNFCKCLGDVHCYAEEHFMLAQAQLCGDGIPLPKVPGGADGVADAMPGTGVSSLPNEESWKTQNTSIISERGCLSGAPSRSQLLDYQSRDVGVNYFTLGAEKFYGDDIVDGAASRRRPVFPCRDNNKSNTKLISQENAVILYADVESYCKLMSLDEKLTITRMCSAIRDMNKLLKRYQGRLVDLAGDGILSTFENVDQALDFAIEFQRNEYNWKCASSFEKKLNFRIGVDVGDVFTMVHGVHGHHVNRAARIQEIADPGGIVVSGEVNKKISSGNYIYQSKYLGGKRFKNISETIHIYSIELDQLICRENINTNQFHLSSLACKEIKNYKMVAS